MRTQHPYELAIKEKLEQLQGPDSDSLWSEMKTILDEKMPEEKKKKRYIFWLMAFIIFAAAGSLLTYNMQTQKKNNTSLAAAALNSPEKKGSSANNTTGEQSQMEIKRSAGNNNYKNLNDMMPERETGVAKLSAFKTNNSSNTGRVSQFFEKGANNLRPADKQEYLFTGLYGFSANKTANENYTENPEERFSFYNEKAMLAEWNRKEAGDEKLYLRSLPGYHLKSGLSSWNRIAERGWVAGISLSHYIPAGSQRMSTANFNGKESKLLDYLPSAYVQYHFNKKWSLQTEFQFCAPQYTPDLRLASNTTMMTSSEKEEATLSLNKLYYLSIPLSVHYSPVSNFRLGTGIQYSLLKHSIYTEEITSWEKETSGWTMRKKEKNIIAISNSSKEKKIAAGNNGGGSTAGNAHATTADTTARSLENSDWRILLDANYDLKRFNIGMRYNIGLSNYINTKAGNSTLQARNQSFQFYIRYNLFDKRKP